MASTTAVLRAEPIQLPRRFLAMLPGIGLLTIVGLAGKVLEKSIATYTKAHHLVVPNIEYVLWAILIGLLISNTVGVAEVFKPGIATYEFWLKTGIVLAGRALPPGGRSKVGRGQSYAGLDRIDLVDRIHDAAGADIQAQSQVDEFARRRQLDLRRFGDYRHTRGY